MAEAEEKGAEEAAPKKKLDLQTILVMANTLMVLAALGATVYTKLLYKKPPIVEEEEIQKKIAEIKSPEPTAEKIIVPFDQLLINIAMTSGKAHYATIALAIECRSEEVAEIAKVKKALLIDKLIALVGKRQMTELNTIQGKLLLKTELMREFSALTKPAGITDLYFSTFILQ